MKIRQIKYTFLACCITICLSLLFYDMVHQAYQLSSNDIKANIITVPSLVNTGLLIISKYNVDEFLGVSQ